MAALPEVDPCPYPIGPAPRYQITAWKNGSVHLRYEVPASRVERQAVGMFKILNSGTSQPGTWSKQGEELKVSFARQWRENDTVVYVLPLDTDVTATN